MIFPFFIQTDYKYIAFILIKKQLQSFFSPKQRFFIFTQPFSNLQFFNLE